jgi:hypothetical protein
VSNLLFPQLAGLDIKINRTPLYNTIVNEALSGREYKHTWWTYPRTRYALDFNVLRTDSSLAARAQEWQAAVGFFMRHIGQGDSFLFADPDDNVVSDHGFAAGDGSTTAFQLQRTLKGAFTDAAGAVWPTQTKPYVNMLKNSSFDTDSNADGTADSWSVYNNSPSLEPTVLRMAPGRTGGLAQRVSWGTGNTSTKGVQELGVSAPAPVAGQWYTVGFFARASGSNIGKWMGLRNNAPTPNQKLFISNPALSAAYQLYVFQVFWNVGTSPIAECFITINNSASSDADNTGTFGDLDIDDVLFVAGQYDATTLPQPNATPAAATGTRNPSYWPVLGEGYEPIFDFNGSPTIYQDGDWQGRRQLYPYTRTNVLWWSEQIDNAGWTKTNATVTANATTAPDGNATADQISEGDGARHARRRQQRPSRRDARATLVLVGVRQG